MGSLFSSHLLLPTSNRPARRTNKVVELLLTDLWLQFFHLELLKCINLAGQVAPVWQ